MGLQVFDGVLGIVEYRGGEGRVGPPRPEHVDEVVESAGSAGRDHGNGHGRRHRRRQPAVEALLRAVAVDRGQQNLAGAAVGGLARPVHRVAPGALPAAADVDPEAVVLALGVDGDDDRLAAVAPRQRGDQRRPGERGGVDAHLVGAGLDGRLGVVFAADAAPDAQRQEYLARDRPDGLRQGLAPLDGRGDVEDDHFVDALPVVPGGQRGGVARAPQTLEIDAFDDRAVANVEAGDDAFRQHGPTVRTRARPGAGSCSGCGGRCRTTSPGGTARRPRRPAQPPPRTRRRSGSSPRRSPSGGRRRNA